MSKDDVYVAQLGLNLLLAFFTISLFWQGQVDRRKVAEDRRREQAAKVSMLRQVVKIKLTSNSWQNASTFLEISNDSDAPVTNIMVLQRAHAAAAAEPEWKSLALIDDPIPTVIPYLPGGESERIDCGVLSGHELELHFTDGAGRSWVKTLQDGALWPKNQYSIHWWAAWYQWLAQIPRIGKVFNWPNEHAIRRMRKTVPKIPLSARIARLLWGSAPGPGPEPHPWRRPFDIPAKDWPYQSMIWFANFERANPRLPTDP